MIQNIFGISHINNQTTAHSMYMYILLTCSPGPERVRDLRKQSCEISKLLSYFPGSFSQHSLINDKFIFQADSYGGIFTNRPSYSLVIPKGAIEKGETLTIQTALINWVGKDCFQFPENYHVVSPVVWFSADRDVKFKLPLEITLQHCAQDSREITILKAKCSGCSNTFKFEPLGKGNPLGTEYITYSIDHFCIYCAGVVNENHQRRICVIPIEKPCIQNEKEVIFCVCYNLDTCISVSTLCMSYGISVNISCIFHRQLKSNIQIKSKIVSTLLFQCLLQSTEFTSTMSREI